MTKSQPATQVVLGRTVCSACFDNAATTADENYRDRFGVWAETDEAHAEVASAAVFMLDDAYANGVLCTFHLIEMEG